MTEKKNLVDFTRAKKQTEVLSCIGINHSSAPLAIRERFHLTKEKTTTYLKWVHSHFNFRECLLLSTCNRSELYIVCNRPPSHELLTQAYSALQTDNYCLTTTSSFNHEDKKYIYCLHNKKAIAHLFRVVSSLDSMIVGETQITGQFKQALNTAKTARTLGTILQRLSQEALATHKKIRSSTSLGQRSVSISHTAIELAKRIFYNLSEESFLLVGAGEMIKIAATQAHSVHAKKIVIANRTLINAKNIINTLTTGKAITLDTIPQELADTSIVISCIGGNNTVINSALLQKIMSKRQDRPLVLLDLGLPRNIDYKCGKISNVYLFTLDDIQQLVKDNYQERLHAAKKADKIIEESVYQFENWLQQRTLKPLIKKAKDNLHSLGQREITRSLQRSSLNTLTYLQQKDLNTLVEIICNKALADFAKLLRNDKCPDIKNKQEISYEKPLLHVITSNQATKQPLVKNNVKN